MSTYVGDAVFPMFTGIKPYTVTGTISLDTGVISFDDKECPAEIKVGVEPTPPRKRVKRYSLVVFREKLKEICG